MLRFLSLSSGKRFFDLFAKDAENVALASKALADLFENYEDVPEKVKRITEYEHEGDNITHQIIELLHLTFVTPIDREDIALLAHSMDDVVDFIEGAITSMQLYRIKKPTNRARELAAIIVRISAELNEAMARLRRRDHPKQILKHCVEINRLENEADEILRKAIVELFDNTSDVVEIIKWKEIYDLLESATDRGEDVANVLEGVVLKHA